MKFLVFTFAFMLNVFGGYSQSLNDSLLLHYPLEGNATDISGNGYDGNVSGAVPTTNWLGQPNSAMQFNGVSSFIDFPNHSFLKPPLPVSASFWVKFDTLLPSKVYVFTTDYDQNRYTGIWFSLQQNTWEMNIHYGDGTSNSTNTPNRRTKKGTTSFEAGIWYFVVGVIRGPNDMDIFVNCRNDGGTYSGTGGSVAYSNMPGSIGRLDMSGLPPYYFQGSLADFRYWNRALTNDDVNDLCSSTAVKQLHKPKVKIYPNPAREVLYVSPAGIDRSVPYRIYNTIGQNVQSGNLLPEKNQVIEIDALEKGVYILSYHTNEGIPITTKFIKK